MSIKKNIIANYIGTGFVALAPIIALPWYLDALGPAQFGLISFIVVLQAMLGLLDAGMSQALIREFSLGFNTKQGAQLSNAKVLFVFERIYWIFALIAAVTLIILSDVVVHYWLNIGSLSSGLGQQAVIGAAVIFFVQFPGSIYRSLLVGNQAQMTLNGLMLMGAVLRHPGGIIVMLWSPTLLSYIFWNCLISLFETLMRAKFSWRILNVKRSNVHWNFRFVNRLWKPLIGLAGASMLAALTVLMDKIILSRMVSIEQFGYYATASTAAIGVLQMIYPIIQAVLPQAIQLNNNPQALRKLSVHLIVAISIIVILSTVIFLTVGHGLLSLWLKKPEAIEAVYPLLSILLFGTALNAFYNVGYINWLVYGKTRRILLVNSISLVLAVILIPPFVISYGTSGAALGWLIINLIGFVISLEWLRKKNV